MKQRIFILPVTVVLGLLWMVVLVWAAGAQAVAALSLESAASFISNNAPMTELHVRATCPYTTIQAAVDAAEDGAVIKVAAGVYSDLHSRYTNSLSQNITQVVYISKSLTVRGGYPLGNWEQPDPETNPSTVDALDQGRGFFVGGAGISVTLEGLRIKTRWRRGKWCFGKSRLNYGKKSCKA